MSDDAAQSEVRRARGKFAAMVAAYGLGVFNDGFFRQSAMLLAITAGAHELQGWVMSVFTLPYLLAAAPAGWLADRFSKRRVVIAAKAMEVAAMLLGGAGILTMNWPLVLAMAFLMGLQSCLFSPALNGSIPELYPHGYVTKANARLKAIVTVMILAGVAAAGEALNLRRPLLLGVPAGRWLVACGVVVIAAIGLAVSLGVPSRPAADPRARFPWTGIVATGRELMAIRRDRLLRTIVLADVFVWFVGALLMMMINKLAKSDLHLSDSAASRLVAAEMLGVAAGGLLAGYVASPARRRRILPPSAMLMAGPLLLVGAVPHLPEACRFAAAFVALPIFGLLGGLLMVPCEAFIQLRPPPGRKGAVLASANFAVFAGLAISGPVGNAINAIPMPMVRFAIVAAGALAFGAWLRSALAREDRE